MVLANQHTRCLDYAQPRDSLLNCHQTVFPLVGDDWREYDGCYMCVDPNRALMFRAGTTVVGFGPRWSQHERASRLTNKDTMFRNLYQSYPHMLVRDQVPSRIGTFQQLEQRMALGVRKNNKEAVIKLFNFSELDNQRLSKLSLGNNQAGTLLDKQYKNICYLFELLYAVAIEQTKNTTQNPGCEWQLRLYSSNSEQNTFYSQFVK